MKETIIVDSTVIVQYLKTGKGVLPVAYEKFNMVISAATYTELLASKTFEDANLEKEVKEFVEKYFSVVEINKTLADEAAKIIRSSHVSLAISYVAATARENNYGVLTEDKRSFVGIDKLKFVEL
jgi:predicted nucleic acid-binding protein